jgi:tryptophan synthase alpha chain
MPFVTAGFPSLADTARALPALAEAGARLIEVGVPFSDPIADGPVIAESMHAALQRGCTPASVFETIQGVRGKVDSALVAMVSYSIVQRSGLESFTEHAARAGFDGLIVPDIDLGDAPDLRAACDRAGLTCTLLVAPTSGDDRIKRIVADCTGFVYALGRVGVTGERADAPDARDLVRRIRLFTDKPVAVGFGISTPGHVRDVCSYADGAIVGSSLVRRMQAAVKAGSDSVVAAAAFTAELAAATER